MTRRIFLSLLGAILAGCADDTRLADGPGSETSGFSARVLDSQGHPIPGVTVRAVALDRDWLDDAASTRDPVLERTVSDGEGWARFKVARGARIAVEIEDSGRAGRIEVDTKTARSADLSVSRGGALRMRTTVPGETIRSVFLAGTAYRASRESDGSWVLRGIAPGWYMASALTDSGMALLGSLRIAPDSLKDTALSADVDSVLLEDFAAPIGRNRYGRLLGGGWWYTTTDQDVYGGRSKTIPAEPYGMETPCEDGNCLDMDFLIDTTNDQRFALVGVDLDRSENRSDGSERLADLSKVSSIRLRASGSGSFRLQLHLGTSARYQTCSAPFEVDGNRKLHDIPISSLVCDDAALADLAHAIGITILAQSDAHLRLGKVVLAGAGPRAVFPDLGKGAQP